MLTTLLSSPSPVPLRSQLEPAVEISVPIPEDAVDPVPGIGAILKNHGPGGCCCVVSNNLNAYVRLTTKSLPRRMVIARIANGKMEWAVEPLSPDDVLGGFSISMANVAWTVTGTGHVILSYIPSSETGNREYRWARSISPLGFIVADKRLLTESGSVIDSGDIKPANGSGFWLPSVNTFELNDGPRAFDGWAHFWDDNVQPEGSANSYNNPPDDEFAINQWVLGEFETLPGYNGINGTGKLWSYFGGFAWPEFYRAPWVTRFASFKNRGYTFEEYQRHSFVDFGPHEAYEPHDEVYVFGFAGMIATATDSLVLVESWGPNDGIFQDGHYPQAWASVESLANDDPMFVALHPSYSNVVNSGDIDGNYHTYVSSELTLRRYDSSHQLTQTFSPIAVDTPGASGALWPPGDELYGRFELADGKIRWGSAFWSWDEYSPDESFINEFHFPGALVNDLHIDDMEWTQNLPKYPLSGPAVPCGY